MIAGLQKLTLLDFPGKVACTLFLGGCNYRCPFCHNSQLLDGSGAPHMTEDGFFEFLNSRKGLLDGVCVTGGEPTLYPQLPDFLKRIRDMGFQVKLDTNGSRPQVLKALVEAGLVDYVAMDIKNSPAQYAATVGVDWTPAATEESIRFLMEDRVDYELRTTLVESLHNAETVEAMGRWLGTLVPGKKPKQLFLQSFVDRDTVRFSGLTAPEKDTVLHYADTLSQYIGKVAVRGT